MAASGHILVLGGPGSGKTTLALLKAQRKIGELQAGQEVLFLSFSRAAVRQVLTRCKTVLRPDERDRIEVQTYHAFCLRLLQSHGRMLGGKNCTFLTPGEERVRKSDFDGDWEAECRRLASREGIYCFDLFAGGAASLMERSPALRSLISDKYPLVIVDEFQDTGDDQWRLVKALAEGSTVVCLADAEQRIFEYRADVNPRRVEILRYELHPEEFDLAGENHRSPSAAGILKYADAVMSNQQLPSTEDVRSLNYYPRSMETMVHSAVVWMFSDLRAKGLGAPTVAVLSRTNALVAKVSEILSEERVTNGTHLNPVVHDVVWDAELSAAAAVVVGTILEWPNRPKEQAIAATLGALSRYFRLKNAEHPSKSAVANIKKVDGARAAVVAGRRPRMKAVEQLLATYDAANPLVGIPVSDWRQARLPLRDIRGLNEVFGAVRLVRLFRATDALATGLADLWLQQGSYIGAADVVRHILDREHLLAVEREPEGCLLMNMYKSKGKEFDGVVLVEGQYSANFLDNREGAPFEQSRRLLRVAITRARTLVTLVRPQGAPPLVA